MNGKDTDFDVVEKKKTGEILAAKVVWLLILKLITGKSSEESETHHALLGEQVDTQVERQE
jgi:hypothetical protein